MSSLSAQFGTYWMESEAIRAFFDAHAREVDSLYTGNSWWRTSFNRIFRRAIYERFSITLAESGDVRGATILDVGCGPGHYALAYARLGAARVVGIDIAQAMIELGRKNAGSVGLGEPCEFICGDFLALDFPDRFDVVLAVGVFDYLVTPLPFLKRMVEFSRGKVIATFPGRSLFRMRLRWLRYALRGVPVCFYRREELDALARSAGLRSFKVISIRSSGTGHVLVGGTGE